MKLAILDVDGTLTETSDLDTDCFTRAIEGCFALTGIETDWSLYVHPTDAGILEELFQRHFKRSPSAAEIAHVQNSFVGYLQRVVGHNDSAFSSVKGAGHFLTNLANARIPTLFRRVRCPFSIELSAPQSGQMTNAFLFQLSIALPCPFADLQLLDAGWVEALTQEAIILRITI
ncbi:MAG: hypothetical protein ABSF90_13105 [Syntrophobacteraceae bacterium]|jgi:hypothetical protein